MTTTLQDLLHAINIIGDDYDVCVDGFDTLAVCPPVKMTPCAKNEFAQALTAEVTVEYDKDGSHRLTYVSDADDKICEMAYGLIKALAGYCYADGYDAWFEGETAEMI